MIRLYLAGPLSVHTSADDRDDIPADRLDAFDQLETWSRREALHWLPRVDLDPHHALLIWNPATAVRCRPDQTRTAALRADIAELARANLAFFLPGYQHSRGAAGELFLCHFLRIPAYLATPPAADPAANYTLERLA